MTFRFIHTADVHLDSPLLSLALKEPEAAELVAIATRQTFANTVELCLEERVDAFLIAGDLYDGELRSMKTAAFFTSEMHRLTAAGIKVFLVRGNHDAASVITKHLNLPNGVHVFSKKGEMVQFESKNIFLHGMSFAKPQVPHSLLPHYKPPIDGAINIGLLHTSLAGSTKHDVYAPCSLQELICQGYDYWALGHIHKREVHADAPRAVVMPGIPQGRHINEAGPKSVTYVKIGGDRRAQISERCTSVVQFERVDVEISGVNDWRHLIECTEVELGTVFDSAATNHVIARVRFSGVTPMATLLRRDADVLVEEVREAGRRSGSTFIESVENDTMLEALEPKTDINDPIMELRSLMLTEGIDRSMAAVRTKELLEDLQSKLPPRLRDRFEIGPEQNDCLIEDYLREGAEEVLARLAVAGERK